MKYWQSGEHCVLRGIVNDRVWMGQSLIAVQDSAERTILFQQPGSQCALPEGYWFWKKGDYSRGTRWGESKAEHIQHRVYSWHTNRVLMFLEPEKYYACMLFWHHETNQFVSYYINFQLPFQRSWLGFDTLDLDLDIVIEPSYEWYWKDEADYRKAIDSGGIRPEWVKGIEQSQPEVFERIDHHLYPLDGSWLNWRPNPEWSPPLLPDGWQVL